ncbi:hypothetical protein ATANTOWER_019312 [Ataeniobius toweri]|uniref:Uncharacterized protein n=1 Tax=Ataeniobius toweri TaxID=208326 RepID=A0ABU7C2S1_9TELE|nr:hypothetical protein [Ataeniobius toweri]
MRGFSLGTLASSHSPNMTVRLIGHSELPLGVNGSVDGCWSCVCLCLALRWTGDQGGQGPGCSPPLAHRLLELGISSPATLNGRSGYRIWMDGFMELNCNTKSIKQMGNYN